MYIRIFTYNGDDQFRTKHRVGSESAAGDARESLSMTNLSFLDVVSGIPVIQTNGTGFRYDAIYMTWLKWAYMLQCMDQQADFVRLVLALPLPWASAAGQLLQARCMCTPGSCQLGQGLVPARCMPQRSAGPTPGQHFTHAPAGRPASTAQTLAQLGLTALRQALQRRTPPQPRHTARTSAQERET